MWYYSTQFKMILGSLNHRKVQENLWKLVKLRERDLGGIKGAIL